MFNVILRFLVTIFISLVIFSAIAQEAPKFKGDMRYRFDRVDEHSKDVRNRHRVRARLGVFGVVKNDFEYGIRLVTGGTSATSTNETLDGGFSSKTVHFDLLYVHYNNDELPFNIVAGKFKNQFKKPGNTELIWDGDLTPEGVALNYQWKSLFLTGGYYWLDERSTSSDTVLHGVQLGNKFTSSAMDVIVGGSYYDYRNIRNQSLLASSAKGNSTWFRDGVNKYSSDYDLLEALLEIKLKGTPWPVSIFGDFVTNTGTSRNRSGWLAGFSIGDRLKFSYNFRRLESDAVVGAFTDGDLAGGGTDGKGHEGNLTYKFTKVSKVSLTHFWDKDKVTSDGKNYHDTQIDFSLKF